MRDAPPSRRGWRPYARDGFLAFLGLGTLLLVVLAVLAPDELQLWIHGGTQPHSNAKNALASPRASAPAPTSPTVTISPVPAAVVLKVTDLPDGYHVLKAGPTVFNATAAEPPPSGWDEVFEPDAGRQARYLLIESAVAVYPDATTAVSAVEAEDAAEQAANAVRQPSIPGLASRQTAWIQPAPDRPGYGIVRITWQELNVVGQVAALGPISPEEPQQTALLAMIERNRISSRT